MLGNDLTASPQAAATQEALDAVVDLVGVADAEGGVTAILRRVCDLLDAERASLLRVLDGEVVEEAVYDRRGGTRRRDWRGRLDHEAVLLEALDSGTAMTSAGGGEGSSLLAAIALEDGPQAMVLALDDHGLRAGFMVVTSRPDRPLRDGWQAAARSLGNAALLALKGSRRYARAREASQTMAGFLHLVVHDLRAPLTVLSGYFDLLRDGTFGAAPESWNRPMELIAAKLAETHRLVDDILLAARFESGALPAHPVELDLDDVARRAAARAEPRALLAEGSVEAVPGGRDATMWADAFLVDRIVDNLVNNALVYGGDHPQVRLSVDASGPCPALRVRDNGIGISSEIHERIFDRFFRVDNDVPGTGFGLHVARILADSCGGSLRVEWSAPGEGSVFRLELPPPPAPPG